MSQKLIQKHVLKGTQEFELVDDAVNVCIRKPFMKEKRLSVVLAILNPEPEVSGSTIAFHSRVKCGPLLTFDANNPSAEEVNAFVDAIKEKAQKEFDAFAGIN